MKMFNALLSGFLFFAFSFSVLAHSDEIKSQKILVNAAKVSDRLVLKTDSNSRLLIQVVQEFLHGATDVSNTSRIILSISQLGELSDVSASFLISESMGLSSVKPLSEGVYQITFSDARAYPGERPESGVTVVKIIDLYRAI